MTTTSSAGPGVLSHEGERHAPPEGEPAREARPEGAWPLGQRVAFRFVCLYLLLYFLPFPIGVIPATEDLAELYDKPWHAISVWVGRHVLHLSKEITVFGGDSTDTTYNYVILLTWFVLAIAGTLLWSILDRRRTEYRHLHGWLRLYVRYVVGSAMILYGALKLFGLQFPSLSLDRLLQSNGGSSPHELLWNFMGYSRPYAFFGGAGEVLGGILLLFRRTTTLGALVVIGVMANVVMLNFCYDIPVKLLSSHLVLATVFLLAPDLKRLIDVFVLNRPSGAMNLDLPQFPRRWMKRGRLFAKGFLIVCLVFSSAMIGIMSYKRRAAPKPPLYGLYEVETFLRNGEAVAPLTTEARRGAGAWWSSTRGGRWPSS